MGFERVRDEDRDRRCSFCRLFTRRLSTRDCCDDCDIEYFQGARSLPFCVDVEGERTWGGPASKEQCWLGLIPMPDECRLKERLHRDGGSAVGESDVCEVRG